MRLAIYFVIVAGWLLAAVIFWLLGGSMTRAQPACLDDMCATTVGQTNDTATPPTIVTAPAWSILPATRCPDGYEIVLRDNGQLACAREFAEPMR